MNCCENDDCISCGEVSTDCDGAVEASRRGSLGDVWASLSGLEVCGGEAVSCPFSARNGWLVVLAKFKALAGWARVGKAKIDFGQVYLAQYYLKLCLFLNYYTPI